MRFYKGLTLWMVRSIGTQTLCLSLPVFLYRACIKISCSQPETYDVGFRDAGK